MSEKSATAVFYEFLAAIEDRPISDQIFYIKQEISKYAFLHRPAADKAKLQELLLRQETLIAEEYAKSPEGRIAALEAKNEKLEREMTELRALVKSMLKH